MVRSASRQGAAVYLAGNHFNAVAYQHVVDTQQRQPGRKSGPGLIASEELYVLELPGEEPVGGGTPGCIEISCQNQAGFSLLHCPEPSRAQQGRCLAQALGTAQSEMRHDHLQFDAGRVNFHP